MKTMKRTVSILLIILMLAGIISMPANASGNTAEQAQPIYADDQTEGMSDSGAEPIQPVSEEQESVPEGEPPETGQAGAGSEQTEEMQPVQSEYAGTAVTAPASEHLHFIFSETGTDIISSVDFGTGERECCVISAGDSIQIEPGGFAGTDPETGEPAVYTGSGSRSIREIETEKGYSFSPSGFEYSPGKYYFVLTAAAGYEFEQGTGDEGTDGEDTVVFSVIEAVIEEKNIGCPRQLQSEIICNGEEVSLKDCFSFPDAFSCYEVSDGTAVWVNEDETAADTETAGGFIYPGQMTVDAEGKYYLVFTPAPGYRFENGAGYIIAEFTVTEKYGIAEGNNQTWLKGQEGEGLEYHVRGNYSDFISIEIDSNELSGDDCRTWEGSVGARISAEYLNTLEDGEHTIVFFFRDGSASGNLRIIDGDLYPEYIPADSKVICESTGTKAAPAAENTGIRADIAYGNLEPGVRYTVEAWLVNAETGAKISDDTGNIRTSSVFTASTPVHISELHFRADTSGLAGETIAVFSTVTPDSGTAKPGAHTDPSDQVKQLYIPEIVSTEATVSGLHTAEAGPETVIRDRVTYGNLVPGKYDIVCSLCDAETGLALIDGVSGKPMEFIKSWEVGSSSGSLIMNVGIDAGGLDGKSIVVTESLRYNGITMAEHRDIRDESQTVHFTGMSTNATSGGGKCVPAASGLVITDTVYYTNLIPGTEYRLEAELVMTDISGTEEPVTVRNGNGDAVYRHNFTAAEPDGKEIVRIPFDGTGYEGKKLVVYETLYCGNVRVGGHADPDGAGQAVVFPLIESAVADADGSSLVAVSEETILTDRIRCTGLETGKEYTVSAVLMDGDDASRFAVDASGSKITAEAVFTAEEVNDIDLKYVFNSASLSGKKAVSFVTVSCGGKTAAQHRDINDRKQTVYFPEISTVADNGNGSKNLTVGTASSIVDTVSYSGLKPDCEYILAASLVNIGSGETVPLEGGASDVRVSLFPKSPDGSIQIPLTLDMTKYTGESLTVCEYLYCGGKLLASHADITDEDQTVRIESGPALFKKDASTHEPLAGAVFALRDITADSEVRLETDESGTAYWPLAAGHSYSYREVRAPEGYIPDGNTYSFRVSDNGYASEEARTMYNRKTGTVTIRKTNVLTGAPVEGAKITVSSASGEILFSQETDAFGCIYFDASQHISVPEKAVTGYKTNFTFRETAAPSGYYLDSTVHSFSVVDDGTVSGTTEIHDAPYGTVTITKTDTEGNPLKGARISVYTSAGSLSGQATTNSEGRIYFAAPSAGTYYFIEDQAPSGYARADRKFAFKIDTDGKITGTTTFTNTKGGVATGDSNEIAIYGCIAAGAAACTAAAYAVLRKKKSGRAGPETE